MINLLFGFGSGSIGLSLDPDAAGADDSVSVTSTAVPSSLLSSLSAPCGVVLKGSSILILQRSECACVCHSPRCSDHIVDGFCVPSVLRFQSPDIASSDHCSPNETLCAVVSHSKPHSVVISGVLPVHRICGDLSCQHFLSERDEFLCRLLTCSISNGVLPSRPF